MHEHLEIILPPVPGVAMPTLDHLRSAVEQILEPFHVEAEGEDRRPSFYDWYVIGGRFAGEKMTASLDQDKLAEFQNWCEAEQLTVSGVRAGKQELQPKSQIPKVDAKWGKLFPEFAGYPCPLFKHSNDQYDHGGVSGQLPDDILHFRDIPRSMKCHRVIVAGPQHSGDGLDAEWMIAEDQWNGCNHMPIAWDRTLGDALNQYMEYIGRYREEFRGKYIPTDNWLVVTVDYHS